MCDLFILDVLTIMLKRLHLLFIIHHQFINKKIMCFNILEPTSHLLIIILISIELKFNLHPPNLFTKGKLKVDFPKVVLGG